MKMELTKSLLKQLTLEGKTYREIAEITGYGQSNIGYWMKRYNLTHLNNNKPSVDYKDKNYFNKIDTKEKAYILGFLLADGYISKEKFSTTVAKRDIEVLEFMQGELGGNILVDNTIIKKQKKYPNASISFFNNTLIRDLRRLSGGYYKEDRHIPRINPQLEKYLLLGFFDGDGCITWGRRKDRNRVWQKISFTSQFKMLEGIQNIIYNQIGVPTKIRPKSGGEKCFVLEFSGKKEVLEFLNYIYNDDFVILKRKYQNASNLRLELEEFGRI